MKEAVHKILSYTCFQTLQTNCDLLKDRGKLMNKSTASTVSLLFVKHLTLRTIFSEL